MLNQMFSSVGAERVRCLARFSGDGPRCIFFGKYILLSTFQGIFFCLLKIISQYSLSEIFCMPMDFNLTVFWSICNVTSSFGEKISKHTFFTSKSGLNVIFGQVLVLM